MTPLNFQPNTTSINNSPFLPQVNTVVTDAEPQYLLSDGSYTSDFFKFHLDTMKSFHKEKNEEKKSSAKELNEITDYENNPVIARIREAKKVEQIERPKLLEALEKLRTFAEERKKNDHRAMNLYSHFKVAIKPAELNERDTGGEWGNISDMIRSAKRYMENVLKANGFGTSTAEISSFLNRYISEYPNLHKGCN